MPYNCSEIFNGTNVTSICYNYQLNYYDDKSNLLDCDYVLDDKTCLKTIYGVTGTETKYDFLNLPTNKEKIVIDGKKIEQKQSGLSIPIPKGSTVQIKIRYSHPLAYGLKVPENVNKYNISMTTADGSVILDPNWFNESYDRKRNITDVPDVDLTLNVNGTSGFYGNRIFVNPANCNGDLVIYYKSINTSDYAVVCNDTTEITWTANGLVSYWKHDNATTNATHSLDSLNVNHGTFVGGVTTGITGQIAEAYDFDGSTGYVNAGDVTDYPLSGLTISAWIKASNFDDSLSMIVSKWGVPREYYFAVTDTGDLKFALGDDEGNSAIETIATNVNLAINTMYYVTVTWEKGGGGLVYKNGEYVETVGSSSTDVINGNRPLIIGGYVTHYFDGLLDEVGIWNRALTSTEVEDLYNNTKDDFNNMLLGAEESAPSANTAPSIISNVTKPDTVYTNTDWKLNITATDLENASFTAYTQFYVNGESSGGEASHSIENNSNTNVANLSSSSFNAGDKLIAEMWVGDNIDNSSKTNSSEITVSNSNPVITANETSPSTVLSNTDFKLNLTITDLDADTLTGYVQFYKNGTSIAEEYSTSPVTNNTNTLIGTLASGNFSAGDTLIAEYWAGDGTATTAKENTTSVTVSHWVMGGTVKDSSNIVVNNAKVIIINQSDNTIVGTTDSNSTGGWTYNIGSTGTYLVVAYDPNNSTRDGDADPHIVVS